MSVNFFKEKKNKTRPCPCSSCSVRGIQAVFSGVLNGIPDLRPSRRAASQGTMPPATSAVRARALQHRRPQRPQPAAPSRRTAAAARVAAPSPSRPAPAAAASRTRSCTPDRPPARRRRRASNRSCRPPSRSRVRVWVEVGDLGEQCLGQKEGPHWAFMGHGPSGGGGKGRN
jgi:hypothetical protein